MRLSSQILLAFLVIILLSVADSYTSYLLSKKVERNMLFLSKSEAVIRNSNQTHKEVIRMQSSFRGYLLTDDYTFLDDYYSGVKKVPALLKRQTELVKDNPLQTAVLDSIRDLHSDWVHYSGSLIESRKRIPESEENNADYMRLFETTLKQQVGKKINDSITDKFHSFDKMEYKVRNSHGVMLNESIKSTHFFSLIFLTLTIIIGLGSTIYIFRLISKRIASMVKLAENISQGNFTVMHDHRNDELTGLSRSLNIMSDKLSRNIHELETRNAELNKFAYVVSHDLKAPIRGIHNVIKWIEEDLAGELSAQLRNYLAIIPQRTQRMEALINGLLDYARISKATPLEDVDVDSLVRDIANSTVPRNFTLEIGKLPILHTERIKLEQVFENLISNAIKYTQNDNPGITINCRELTQFYEFSVKDNGIGIDPEYHSKIFEIFQTLREKNEKESTGVGLAIVKKIIVEQQGKINVKSSLGEGAEFIFTWKK